MQPAAHPTAPSPSPIPTLFHVVVGMVRLKPATDAQEKEHSAQSAYTQATAIVDCIDAAGLLHLPLPFQVAAAKVAAAAAAGPSPSTQPSATPDPCALPHPHFARHLACRYGVKQTEGPDPFKLPLHSGLGQ